MRTEPHRHRQLSVTAAESSTYSPQKKTSLALLSIPALAVAASYGRTQDMSWLGGNWYGVIAFFGIPALLGILCWTGAHYVIGARHRHERARETRRRPF
jgi:hypothetical protein